MRKPFTVALLLIVPLLLLGFAGVSQAQLVLYDDFKGKVIDPAKWTGSEGSFGPSAPNTDATRSSVGGQLQMSTTTWGRTDSDTGAIGPEGSRLNITDPAPITTFQADVTVKSVNVVGCNNNTTFSFSLAQVEGGYFNDGTSSGSGDRTGDIIAVIQKTQDSVFDSRIEAVIIRCTNTTCSGQTNLTFHFFGTTWKEGKTDTLRLQWDQGNHQFMFTVNPDGQHAETVALAYNDPFFISDSNPPVVAFRQLSIGNKPASCMPPAPRTMAAMTALFDNVMVNP
jgi:hypothetical protein